MFDDIIGKKQVSDEFNIIGNISDIIESWRFEPLDIKTMIKIGSHISGYLLVLHDKGYIEDYTSSVDPANERIKVEIKGKNMYHSGNIVMKFNLRRK